MSESADAASSQSSHYFKLGLFVLVTVALIVAGVVVLGAGALFRRSIPAETVVYESVNGLDVGSAVKFRGVPIGKVSGIVFASAKYPESAETANAATTNPTATRARRDIRGIVIEMSLAERSFPGQEEKQITDTAKQMIGQGLRARVTPAGISGQSYVDLDILNPSDSPPPPISWTPESLYIPSAPSTIGQVLDAAGQIAADLQKADLRKVVAHVDELTTQMTATVAEARSTLSANRENLTRTMASLPEAAARIKATAARADELMHDPRVDKAMTNLSDAAAAATPAVADVRRLAHEAQQLLAGEAEDVRALLADLRRAAADATALLDDAKANPSRVLFGKPPPAQPQPVPPQ